jgi:hypothetical protein
MRPVIVENGADDFDRQHLRLDGIQKADELLVVGVADLRI